MTLIGKSLEVAKAELISQGYDVNVVVNTSDKCKVFDTMMVTQVRYDGKVATIVVSPFYLEVKGD